MIVLMVVIKQAIKPHFRSKLAYVCTVMYHFIFLFFNLMLLLNWKAREENFNYLNRIFE